MRKKDLIRLCLQNLLRKKSRTLLTVLGVVIGGCSIVIMVSLGIGMKESQERLLAELGDLTIITVNPPQGGRGKTKLDSKTVHRLRALQGVTAVMPRKSLESGSTRLLAGTSGRYVADWTSIMGLEIGGMEEMGFHLARGERGGKERGGHSGRVHGLLLSGHPAPGGIQHHRPLGRRMGRRGGQDSRAGSVFLTRLARR